MTDCTQWVNAPARGADIAGMLLASMDCAFAPPSGQTSQGRDSQAPGLEVVEPAS
ncbi:MAG: hypothetical protein ACRDS0_24140 [Pseudonocardiaceae bacterium]